MDPAERSGEVPADLSLAAPDWLPGRYHLRVQQLVPGQQYTISVCLNNRCSTMTTTAEFLDPAGSTDSTVVDPDRPTQPFVRIAVVLLDVADTVDLDLTIEAVEDRGVIYEASGPSRSQRAIPTASTAHPRVGEQRSHSDPPTTDGPRRAPSATFWSEY